MKFRSDRLTPARRIAFGCAAFLLASVAYTQDSGEPTERVFSREVGAIVNESQPNLNYEEQRAKLEQLIAYHDLNPYERSTIHSMMGAYSYELDDIEGALLNYQKAIDAGGLLPKEIDAYESNIAQLFIANGQYVEGAQRLEAWVKRTGQETPKYVQYIMQAWVQAEDYHQALPWAEKWFENAYPKERKHFDLLNFIYNDLSMRGKRADVLKGMVARWPDDRQLWDSWMSLLVQSGRHDEAFAVSKLMYDSGRITDETSILKFVEAHRQAGIPFEGGLILERELNAGRVKSNTENLMRLYHLYTEAREDERALSILEIVASRNDNDRLKIIFVQDLTEIGQCQKAATTLNQMLKSKEGLNKSWMRLGICFYDSSKKEEGPNCYDFRSSRFKEASKFQSYEAAIQAFEKIQTTSPDFKSAQKWITFINLEMDNYDNRCDHHRRDDICMIKIDNAYKLEIIKGGFFLDESCMKYKDDYDRHYRRPD